MSESTPSMPAHEQAGTEPPLTREPPRSARGVRTRASLVKAARIVFERDGYLNARLVDITIEAGSSAGSFYTYFSNKEEVFAAVMEEVQEEMLHPRMHSVDHAHVVAGIEASNREYLEAYRRNAKLMDLLGQVAAVNDDFRELRRRRAAAFVQRNARSICSLQRAGLADPQVDALLAAHALSAMVSRLAYSVFVLGHDGQTDFDTLVYTVTRLWTNALRLPWPYDEGSGKSAAVKRVRAPTATAKTAATR